MTAITRKAPSREASLYPGGLEALLEDAPPKSKGDNRRCTAMAENDIDVCHRLRGHVGVHVNYWATEKSSSYWASNPRINREKPRLYWARSA